MNGKYLNLEQSTFFEYLRLTRQEDDNGAVVVTMNVEDLHKDASGNVASGVYYTVLDVALGTAVSEQMNGFSATIDMHVQVFNQEKIEKLVCKGYLIDVNGNIGSGRGDLFDGNDVLVATGMATFKLMKNIE